MPDILSSAIGIAVIIGLVLVAMGTRKRSAVENAKEELRVRRDEEKRIDDEEELEKTLPRAEAAAHTEKVSIETILAMLKKLTNEYLANEKKIIAIAETEMKRYERSEKQTLRGEPAANPLRQIIGDENSVLSMIDEELKKPEEIVQRLEKYEKQEIHTLERATKRLNREERVAIHDHALSDDERKGLRTEDGDENKIVHLLRKAQNEERSIYNELEKTRRLCRQAKHLNDEILADLDTNTAGSRKHWVTMKEIQMWAAKKRQYIEEALILTTEADKVSNVIEVDFGDTSKVATAAIKEKKKAA